MSDDRRRYIFGVAEIPEDTPSRYSMDDSPEDIKDVLTMLHPQLETAEMNVDDEGNIHFRTVSGEKG